MTAHNFLSEINPPIHLSKAALAFARSIAYPELDCDYYLDQINIIKKSAKAIIPANFTPTEKAKALSRFLFGPGGFRGNSANYYDPRNSFLNEVIERKLGLPITLTAILIEVGRHFDLDIRGISLPGHFIAAAFSEEESIYLDPFHGGRQLSLEDCKNLVITTAGLEMEFNPEWLEPVSQYDMLVRMLNNLRMVYVQECKWHQVLQVLELLQIAQPNEPEHIRDIGLIHYKCDNRRKAIYYLEAYTLRKFGAKDISSIRKLLSELVEQEARSN